MAANSPQSAEEKKARSAKRLLWIAIGTFLLVNTGILLKVFLPPAKPSSDLMDPALARAKAPGTVLDPAKSAEFLQAAQSPRLFRQSDRVYRFDSLLLTGDPNIYKDLLEHLQTTKDWVLTYLDHTSLVFRRAPVQGWKPSDLDELREKFANRSVRDRVFFEVQLAARLLAVNQASLAKEALDRAIKLDADSPEAWTQLASWNGTTGRWKDALVDCEKALNLRKNYAPALTVKAQAYYATGRFGEAFITSNALIQSGASDPQSLFLHARIAHEARAYSHEIDALKKLIAMAEKANQPVSTYKIYLGQAYAKRGESGDAQDAVQQLESAQNAGDLTADQEKFIQEALTRIRAQM